MLNRSVWMCLAGMCAILGLGEAAHAAEPPADKVPMIVAFGHGDRTVVSCDDGKTWVANQYVEDREAGTKRYSEDQMRAIALAYDNGVFVKYVGWNGPVKISRSENGVDWTVTADRDQGWSWDGAAANGVFLLGAGKTAKRSLDGGRTWQDADAGVRIGHAKFIWGDYDGGRWVKYGDGLIGYSTDNGATWQAGKLLKPELDHCLRGDAAYGGGRFVVVGSFGADGPRGPYLGCWSSDGGQTWHVSNEIADRPRGLVWDGNRFLLYTTNNTVYQSPNGEVWTEVKDTSGVGAFGTIVRTDRGTFIALEANGGKPKDGSTNHIFRSSDGLHWTKVTFVAPGDQLTHLRFGYGNKPEACE